MKRFKDFKYKNLTLVFLSILLAINLSRFDFMSQFLFNLGHFALIGPFIAGVLFVSTFTAAIGITILLDLAKTLSPLQIALIAGAGAVVGDFVFFHFFKSNLLSEIKYIYNKFGGQRLTVILHHRYLAWSLPLIGAFIIASPFPDEIGVSLMGLTRMKNYQFLLLSFALNSTGIFILVSTYSFLKT